jgi:hypothetical protein
MGAFLWNDAATTCRRQYAVAKPLFGLVKRREQMGMLCAIS